MDEKVSVIIPAFNAKGTLKQCLGSVFESDLRDCEVILVDDCSRDETSRIAGAFPCTIIRNGKNLGAAAARNIGAKKAKNDFLLFIDSDVVVQKDLLKRTVETFRRYPQISAWVGTFSKKHWHKGFFSQYKNLHFYYYSTKIPFYTTGLNSAIAAVKKKAFFAVGGFDAEKKSVAEDVDFGMRLSNAGFLIFQSKEIEVEHLKNLSQKAFFRNDFERGKSIAGSLFSILAGKKASKKGTGKAFSFLQFKELYLSIPLPLLFLFFFAAGFFYLEFFFVAAALLFVFVFLNSGFWFFLAGEKGIFFAIASVTVTFFDMLFLLAGILFGFFSAVFLNGGAK